MTTCRAQLAYPYSIDTMLVSHTSRDIPLETRIINTYAQVARSHWGTAGPVDLMPIRTCLDRAYYSRSGRGILTRSTFSKG